MTPEQDRPTVEVLKRVQGEFLEMPGLRLTSAQACRLWGLDATVCDAVLGALVDAKFLFKTRDGAFVKSEHATSGWAVRLALEPISAGRPASPFPRAADPRGRRPRPNHGVD